MGFNFGFFGTPQHREFNYRPVYYDPEKEALKERFAKAEAEGKAAAESRAAQEGAAKKEYVPGQYIKGSITDRNYRVERGANKFQKVLGAVALVLAFAVVYLIAKYFPLIWQ